MRMKREGREGFSVRDPRLLLAGVTPGKGMDARYQPAGMAAIILDSDLGIWLSPGAFRPGHRSFAISSG